MILGRQAHAPTLPEGTRCVPVQLSRPADADIPLGVVKYAP